MMLRLSNKCHHKDPTKKKETERLISPKADTFFSNTRRDGREKKSIGQGPTEAQHWE